MPLAQKVERVKELLKAMATDTVSEISLSDRVFDHGSSVETVQGKVTGMTPVAVCRLAFAAGRSFAPPHI